jgi:hypothetical protein
MEMSRWTIISLYRLLYGAIDCHIRNTKTLAHISNWLVETPEYTWDIWHIGNILTTAKALASL